MTRVKDWLFATAADRHRPPHYPERGLATFVTASTYDRIWHLGTPLRRDAFVEALMTTSREAEIEIVAWVVLAEHYHLIAAPVGSTGIAEWLKRLHRGTSTEWNREDGRPGRQCWYEHWDHTLWTEGDLLSRVNYIHMNPVRHRWVEDPGAWRWGSLREWTAEANADVVERLGRFPAPRKVPNDDF